MRICFTWFLICGLGETNIYHQSVCFTRMWEDCGGLSDCEELVDLPTRGWEFNPQTLVRWVVGGVLESVVSKANSQDRRPLAPVIRLLKWYGR